MKRLSTLFFALIFVAALYGALTHSTFNHGAAIGAMVVASIAAGLTLAKEAWNGNR